MATSFDRFSTDSCALIMIDVQNDFCHEDGVASRAGLDVSAVASTIGNVESLLEAARKHDVPRVFVRTEHGSSVDSDVWTHRTLRTVGGQPDVPAPNCVGGTWGAEFFVIQPDASEAVVTKHRYSAFANTTLEELLSGWGRRSLIFVGYTTNVCVETSLRDALCRDFAVSVVSDACSAFREEEHDTALENIGKYFGIVIDTRTLVSLWESEST